MLQNCIHFFVDFNSFFKYKINMQILMNIFNKIYLILIPKLLKKKITVSNRHSNYSSYINKQKEKTIDPHRIAMWKGEEWEVKLDGFRKLFKRNKNFIRDKKKGICLGARTGQEVVALQEIGINSIGIDLVSFPPYTEKGDIHNLKYKKSSFDFVFTNIFDHSMYPEKFVSEMERVCSKNGIIIINLQINNVGDDYSENVVYNPSAVENLFKNSTILISRKIKNTFDSMNHEIVIKKN